ncbi:MAG: transcriptional regulator [Desulfurococcales archaeon]|jgi:DNA-binding PadR family transcriptional regulator
MYTPERYAVLEAIARGARSPEEISSTTGLSIEEVLKILSWLNAEGLVEKRIRGLIFKREVYEPTSKAWVRLDEWRDIAKRDLERAEKLRRAGMEEEADEILSAYASILPFLLTLEIFSFLALNEAMVSADITDLDNADFEGEVF